MTEYLKTPEEVSRELHEEFNFGQAQSIAAEVYQPLLDEIKRLEKRLEALERPASLLREPDEKLPEGCYCAPGRCAAPKVMGRQMSCRDPAKAQHSACGTKGCPYCDR